MACFEDEARFGQQGTLTRVWAKTGSGPAAVRQTQYEYLYALSIACPESGDAWGLMSPYLNTKVINLFLKQFSERLPADVHAALFWDGAGYHRAGKLRVPGNITLIPLPPYSPELNPMENLWHHLRSHYWANRFYADYDDLLEAATDGWRRTCLNPEIIRSVCACPYLHAQD